MKATKADKLRHSASGALKPLGVTEEDMQRTRHLYNDELDPLISSTTQQLANTLTKSRSEMKLTQFNFVGKAGNRKINQKQFLSKIQEVKSGSHLLQKRSRSNLQGASNPRSTAELLSSKLKLPYLLEE